jgi:HEAT repeat protein
VAEALAQHAGDLSVLRLAGLLADTDERVRSTAGAMLGRLGNRSPGMLAALVRAPDLPGESARARACAALSELTGRTMTYDPNADPATRDRTIPACKDWLAEPRKP